jgi:ribosomal protein S18 acetylase RimI-like enzyme
MTERAIPILHVEDAGRAVRWYERLGFVKAWEHRFERIELRDPGGNRLRIGTAHE